MQKTPDEIKKGPECCLGDTYAYHCDECPYADDESEVDDGCGDNGIQLLEDALALIQQLESDKQQLEGMLTHMNQLRDAAAGRALKMEERAHQLEAERDAALADFKLYRERNIKGECGVYACDLCKHGGKYEEWEEIKCPKGCMGIENWEWRGVQKEGEL